MRYRLAVRACRRAPAALALLLFAFSMLAGTSAAAQASQAQRGARPSSPERPLQPYRRSVAIVVGIDNYTNGISPLKYAVADARAVANLLETRFGFEVRLLLNEEAKKERLLSEIIGLSDRTGPDDQLIFFFAGHGKSFGENSQESGYILPSDATDGTEDQVWSSGISMDDLVRRLRKLPPKHLLVLLDTCYSGYAAVSFRGSAEIDADQLLRRLTSLPGRHLLSAGKRGQLAMEKKEWGHSAFTFELLRALGGESWVKNGGEKRASVRLGDQGLADRNRDGLIPVSELNSFLLSAVTKRTHGAQTPHLEALDDAQGEFVFIPKPRWRPASTSAGIRRKALIPSPEVPLYRSPHSAEVREATVLETYYLFEGEVNGRVPVGAEDWSPEPEGWLEAGSFIEWNNLEAALIVAKNSSTVPLFSDRACAIRFAEEGGMSNCVSIPLPSGNPKGLLIFPLLDRWGEAYKVIVLPLLPARDLEVLPLNRRGYLMGWLPRRAGSEILLHEVVFVRRGRAKILAHLIEILSGGLEDAVDDGIESFVRKVSAAFAAITRQETDLTERLDSLMGKISHLPYRTTTLAFSLEEVKIWKPKEFLDLNEILAKKSQALNEFLLNPANVHVFNGRDYVFVPRNLFP